MSNDTNNTATLASATSTTEAVPNTNKSLAVTVSTHEAVSTLKKELGLRSISEVLETLMSMNTVDDIKSKLDDIKAEKAKAQAKAELDQANEEIKAQRADLVEMFVDLGIDAKTANKKANEKLPLLTALAE